MVDTADWQADVLRLKGEGLSANDIAEQVGKHVATVRKVIARAPAEPEVPFQETSAEIYSTPSTNGNGHGPMGGLATVDAETAERLRKAAGMNEDRDVIPGQIDIEGGEVPSHEDLHNGSGLDWFKQEAGEPVGDMPPTAPEGEVTYVEKPRIDGTRQVAFDFGGALAEEGTLTFTGTFPSGFFEKGDVISGTFKARIVSFTPKDKLDKKSGTFVAAPQAHTALITVLEVD